MADTATMLAAPAEAAEIDDPARRPVVTLLAGGHRRAEAGHPWIFSNEIAMDAAAKALAPGTLVTLRRSDERPPDVARPIGKRFFVRHLERALRLRERLYRAPYYRLVHAEADGLPGLVIDRFGGVLVVQANAAGIDRLMPVILDALHQLLMPEAIMLRNDSPARALEGLPAEARIAAGQIDGPVAIEENGAGYEADGLTGQKTGWFFDQRDNRGFIAGLAGGARVLDLYCYSGGFSIAAACGGAASVLGIHRR